MLSLDVLCYLQKPKRRLNYLENSTNVHKRMKENNPPMERPVIGSIINREPTINT